MREKHNMRKSGIDEQVTNQWFAKALYVRKISDLAFRLFFGQSGNIPLCSSVLDTFSARFRGITARAVVRRDSIGEWNPSGVSTI